MSESDNEPIFAQLARERGYAILIGEGNYIGRQTPETVPYATRTLIPGVTYSEAQEGFSRLSEVIQGTGKAELVVDISPTDLMDKGVQFHEFVAEQVRTFRRNYPALDSVQMSTEENRRDGTVTLTISECDKSSEVWKEQEKTTPVRGMSGLPPFFKNPHQVESEEEAGAAVYAFVKPVTENLLQDPVAEMMGAIKEEISQTHPNAVITSVTPEIHDDGSATMKVEAVDLIASSLNEDIVKVGRGEMTVEEFRKKIAKTTVYERIGEDTPDSLYMKPDAWEADGQ